MNLSCAHRVHSGVKPLSLGGVCSWNFSSAQISLSAWASKSLGSASSFPQAGQELGIPTVLLGLCRARGCPEPLHPLA